MLRRVIDRSSRGRFELNILFDFIIVIFILSLLNFDFSALFLYSKNKIVNSLSERSVTFKRRENSDALDSSQFTWSGEKQM